MLSLKEAQIEQRKYIGMIHTTLPSSKMTEKSQRPANKSEIIKANFCGNNQRYQIKKYLLLLACSTTQIKLSANWNNAI